MGETLKLSIFADSSTDTNANPFLNVSSQDEEQCLYSHKAKKKGVQVLTLGGFNGCLLFVVTMEGERATPVHGCLGADRSGHVGALWS